jgi:hypothetical protein
LIKLPFADPYAAFLGVFVGHATTHILSTLLFDGYTPGVIAAALGVGTFIRRC